MKKAELYNLMMHLTIALVPPLVLAVVCVLTKLDMGRGYLHSVFCLFTGLLLALFLPLALWSIPLLVTTTLLVRAGVILHYTYRTIRQPEVRRSMYVQNAVLTALTALCGFFLMIIYGASSGV